MPEMKNCPICGSKMSSAFYLTLLGKYNVEYYLCPNCGLLQTEKPYWLDEAYKSAIADIDTGIVNRNIINSKRLEPVLNRLFAKDAKYVDEAGGYGLLTRILRDKGFDCYSYDKYCDNIFAKDFTPSEGNQYNAVFAFEVFEHIEDPEIFIKECFKKYSNKTILFSTLVYEHNIPNKDWWYYAPEAGQHISFYTTKALAKLAEKAGCNYYRITRNFHIITDIKLSFMDRFLLLNKIIYIGYYLFVSFKRRNITKIHTDFDNLKRKHQAANN
jgi:hypothetical protein